MWPMNGQMGAMWLWWLFGVAVLALLVWSVVRAAGSPTRPLEEDSPEAILKRRYARGELDATEYERRLSDLRK
jgi:putative membrane protein